MKKAPYDTAVTVLSSYLGGTVAATTSPGYVAQDLTGYIPPIDNMRSTIPVIGSAAGAVAYVEFFQS